MQVALTKFVLAPILATPLAACVGVGGHIGPPVRAYAGPELPDHQLAELVATRDLRPAAYARLVAVNEKIYGDDWRGFPMSVKVTPGEHRVQVACDVPGRTAYPALTAVFKAGHVYEFQCRESPYGTTAAAMVDHGAMYLAPEPKAD